MTLFEPVSVAFVVRFWLERREIESAEPVWRGVVEYLPTGERHYFDRIDDLLHILAPYLVIKKT